MLQSIAAIIISNNLGHSGSGADPRALERLSTAPAKDAHSSVHAAFKIYTLDVADSLPSFILKLRRELHLSRLNLFVGRENIVAIFETRRAQLMDE